ncbi:MAG: excinuclease ABC subunit UvrB [Planctomycetota bacterium]
MREFRLVSDFAPTGDQPAAIKSLVSGLNRGEKHQVLLGVTGSGKTFTMANVIQQVQRPALIVAHNKTLAAQLWSEFRELFPENAVEYFVSYYDYYQPEAYVPQTDTYIAKDAQINERIDRMRHSATHALLDRSDVIIVASVSCIYGLGSPEAYHGQIAHLEVGMQVQRDDVLRKLAEIQYKRTEFLERGRFRVRGDVIDVFPAYEESTVVRVEFFGDEVSAIAKVDSLTGELIEDLKRTTIYPATHYVVEDGRMDRACEAIEAELEVRLEELKSQGKLLEHQRLDQRTRYDLELLRAIGSCQGIENYSRHMEGRNEGEPPPTLMDFLPRDALVIIDESHATVPQMFGMYVGDRARKEVLVKHGFRLPSAMDNRPLKKDELQGVLTDANRQVLYVSATPAEYELEKAGGQVVEQIIRPTGLADPQVEVRPAKGQIEDVVQEVKKRIARTPPERVLVTTLTKRMAEDLTEYLRERELRVKYLHSDIDTLERTAIIKDLRIGHFDVLVGINLLREGLDIPEVSLVAILDADKEGFLRSTSSLIQTMGRCARNLNATAVLYADKMTDSMEAAIGETTRRRQVQEAYNKEHNITPKGIVKTIVVGLEAVADGDYLTVDEEFDGRASSILARTDQRMKKRGAKQKRQSKARSDADGLKADVATVDIPERIKVLRELMREAAQKLEYELAIELRDEINELEKLQLELL